MSSHDVQSAPSEMTTGSPISIVPNNLKSTEVVSSFVSEELAKVFKDMPSNALNCFTVCVVAYFGYLSIKQFVRLVELLLKGK